MKKRQRVAALLLSLVMMVPTQGMTSFADMIPETGAEIPMETETGSDPQTGAAGGQSGISNLPEGDRIEETLPLEPVEQEENTGGRIEETLPLEPVESEFPLDGLTEIYWNPGGNIPQEIRKSTAATGSDAEYDAGSDEEIQIPKGRDGADGLTPEHPVKSLEKALRQAGKLASKNGLALSDITIYAMNPMEIPDGEMYALNGGNVRIASWPERGYYNDTIFYVNGGQLALINTTLETGGGAAKPEDAELVHVYGGALQLGQNAVIDGRIVMDYSKDKVYTEWEKATASNANTDADLSSDTGVPYIFDLDNYILNTNEDEWELIQDKSEERTWRDPIIELVEGFNGAEGSYLLELQSGVSKKNVTLVETLYADETEPEEFAGFFRLADMEDEWRLVPDSKETGRVHDTGAEQLKQYYRQMLLSEEEDGVALSEELEDTAASEMASVTTPVTVKTLSAVPLNSGTVVYWNPGGILNIGGHSYPAGVDENVAGSAPEGAFKSLEKASAAANGGTVICMQTVVLGPDSGQYLWGEKDGDHISWAKSPSSGVMVTVRPWETNLKPIFSVPEGEILGLENIILEGADQKGLPASSQAVICEGGDIVIGSGVTADTGYLQINGSKDPDKDLKNHPLKVRDADGGKITVFFGGINDNLAYRYTDVVIPDGALKNEADTGDASRVGELLLDRVRLESSNKGAEEGGNSQFDWILRQDTTEDDAIAHPQNLELYVDYYFDAVYVNGQTGDDENYGATCQYPVKTFEKAKDILEREAEKSRVARQAASGRMDKAELDKKYPFPDKIYLCDTIEVDTAQSWTLGELTDYDGAVIRPEVVSHTDIPKKEDKTPVHSLTKAMVKIKHGGSLELRDLVIRNITDEKDSVTVRVEDGGTLTMKGSARLTGAQAAWDKEEAQTTSPESLRTKYARVTRGTHVWVEDGGVFTMPSNWSGSIERRGQGVYVEGSRSDVTMSGGEIRRNNGLDTTQNQNSQVKGAGLCLTNGATVTIDGGKITENLISQYGGGIYVSGTGTTLKLKRGEVSSNRMAQYAESNSVTRVVGYGIGIYGGKDTVLEIGIPGGEERAADVLIEHNEAFRAEGVGVKAEGTVRMYHTSLSYNTSEPWPNDTSSAGVTADSKGIGLHVPNYAGAIQIEDSRITNNGTHMTSGSGSKTARATGAGIYLGFCLEDNAVISNCQISNNYSGKAASSTDLGAGGGIYTGRPLKIEKSEITDNRSGKGGAIFARGINEHYQAPVTVSDTVITGNRASYNPESADTYGSGGGIQLESDSSLSLHGNTRVEGNEAGTGGGIYAKDNVPVSVKGTESAPVSISHNLAVSAGGGVYVTGNARIYAEYAKICDNQGSGIYGYQGNHVRFRDVEIKRNKGAATGGGISCNGYSSAAGAQNIWYLTNVTIEDNEAEGQGGGIYASGNIKLHFSESAAGKSSLSGNKAREGGGIYCGSFSDITVDLPNMSNTAALQGGNIYYKGGTTRLLNGTLERTGATGADAYNIYLDTMSGNYGGTFILDPQKVNIAKKAQDDPKVIFLNTGDSYLSYLTAPAGAAHTLPIDLNKDAFYVGSVIIKPADLDSVEIERLKAGDIKGTTEKYPYTYTRLKSAAENLDYSRGGILPRKTRIGAYQDAKDSTLTNAVLVGEGVYLASYGDDDKPGAGDTPENPVKTFKKAKELLEDYITEAADDPADSDGFTPYIYICGNVHIDRDETWELDPMTAPFDKDSNNKFWEDEEAYAASQGIAFDEENGKTQVRRFTSFLTDPMITVEGGALATTNFTLDKIILDGMADGVVTAEQGDSSPVIQGAQRTEVTLKGHASVRNNYSLGIVMTGGTLVLTGEESDPNLQVRNIGGTGVRLENGAHCEMQGSARILMDKRGIPSKSTVYGIEANADSSVLMKDHSRIEGKDELIGICLTNPEIVEMEDFAELQCWRGMEINSSSTKSNKIRMNMRGDAGESDSAKITGGTSGIYVYNGSANLDLQMGKKAMISNLAAQAIQIDNNKNASILMQDDSRIEKCTKGINVDYTSEKFKIHMKNRAAIAGNFGNGISASGTIHGFELLMEEYSRISGNYSNGIYLGTAAINEKDLRTITLKDHAVIGGISAFDRNDPETGNQNTGILCEGAAGITITGDAAVKYNGQQGMYFGARGWADVTLDQNAAVEKNGGKGIQLNCTQAQVGKGTLVLAGDGRIKDNQDQSIYSNEATYNTWDITLKDRAAIRDNKSYMEIGSKTSLYLKDDAVIGKSTSGDSNIGLKCGGKLFLDGTAVVEDDIYLKYQSADPNPITVTKKVTDSAKTYRLQLEQGFMGQIVVQPDDPDGTHGGVTDLNSPPRQLPHFVKVAHDKEGLIADKVLYEDGKNIVLQGNNDIYLSGNGRDSNSGMTPDTPVRTFKQAKWMLENGRFSKGANIIICGEVSVGTDDLNWSFDVGGTVTNQNTGDTWKPLVTRWEGYKTGNLIATNSASNVKLELSHITIDGGAENGLTCTTDNDAVLLYVRRYSSVKLGAGAVLQNNHLESTRYSACAASAATITGGTLEIDGGIIRNTSINRSANNSDPTAVVACYCYSGTPGRLIMKSGSVTGNKVVSKSGDTGVFVVNEDGFLWEMSGGVISDNTLLSKQTGSQPGHGSALTVLRGNAAMSGGAIRNNKGVRGSAVYDASSGEVVISGGQIQNNISTDAAGQETPAVKEQSAIYVAGSNFQLKGGGAAITDKFYLDSTKHIIKVSGNIYQSNRLYDVFVNTTSRADGAQFKKGSVVVAPDGVWMKDVTPYLVNFQVLSKPYVLDRGQADSRIDPDITAAEIEENKCLLLMQAVYLDSITGKDTNDGTTPAKAVKTFTQAKRTGESGNGGDPVKNYYIIYISGLAVNTASEDEWSLETPAYLCRYTGFEVYDAAGIRIPDDETSPYYGPLIQPDPKVNPRLTLKNINVYGRRNVDSSIYIGESLVRVAGGVTVTMEKEDGESTILGRNRNNGGYNDPEQDGDFVQLSSKGGAVYVEKNGTFNLSGGTILDVEATNGSAVYVEADTADPDKTGTFYVTGGPSITGKVFLDGTEDVTAAYIRTDKNYRPSESLEVEVRNDYHGRTVIDYTDHEVPGLEELKLFKFNDALQALYEITNRKNPDRHILELYQRVPIYLDGQNGDDAKDGTSPATAFKTLERVYRYIQEKTASDGELKGIAIFVVDTVEVSKDTEKQVELNNIMVRDADGSYHYEGSYKDSDTARMDIKGQVYFKRYSQPKGYDPALDVEGGVYQGFGKPTHKGSLFTVKDGGDLTLSGIYLDGHSNDSAGDNVRLAAKGVEALAPLITVTNGGAVHCKVAPKDYVANGIDTATLLTNNTNVKRKDTVLGTLYEGTPDAVEVREGSSAGIELLDLGAEAAGLPLAKAELIRSEFKNLKLGGGTAGGGSDVYSNGELHIGDLVLFEGTVFLEGLGMYQDPDTYQTSRFIYADTYTYPAKDGFQVLIRDPYDTRTIVKYPLLSDKREPGDQEKRLYLLEERVKERFYLNNRETYPQIMELQIPKIVYIDGIGGNDAGSASGTAADYAGSTPKNPVKTLRRAFSLLKSRGGGTIYVVNNPIQIDNTVTVTGTGFDDEAGEILLKYTEKIRIERYVQPDFAKPGYMGDTDGADEYQVEDYTGALVNVKTSGIANFSSHVIFDGHSEPRNERDDPKELVTSAGVEANAPLITVETGGRLELGSGVTLQNNHNTGTGAGHMDGGAIHNSGTAEAVGTVFENTTAKKGAAVYQNGTFTILGNAAEPALVFNGDGYRSNQFYLTTVNNGTTAAPVWGEDHVLQIGNLIPDAKTGDMAYQIEMDHAEPGRDVIRFVDPSAYLSDPAVPGCDPEYEHFRLGSTVPEKLFLVQSEDDETILELQDWKVLHVEAPEDIYLVITRMGNINTSTALYGIKTETDDLFSAPEYQINNKGRYEVKVTLAGMDDLTAAAGITKGGIRLKTSSADVVGKNDLYLGIRGLDRTEGFMMAESALTAEGMAPVEMGTLKAGTAGNFAFTALAGTGFVDEYKDMNFPITDPAETMQSYMDGTSIHRDVNARAKYLLKYKVELTKPRRNK